MGWPSWWRQGPRPSACQGRVALGHERHDTLYKGNTGEDRWRRGAARSVRGADDARHNTTPSGARYTLDGGRCAKWKLLSGTPLAPLPCNYTYGIPDSHLNGPHHLNPPTPDSPYHTGIITPWPFSVLTRLTTLSRGARHSLTILSGRSDLLAPSHRGGAWRRWHNVIGANEGQTQRPCGVSPRE